MPSRRQLLATATASTFLAGCLETLPILGGGESPTHDDRIEPTGNLPGNTTALAQFQHDPRNTGRTDTELSPDLTDGWDVDTEFRVECLVATDDAVFFLQEEGLWAYDAVDGEPRWHNPFHTMFSWTPAVTADTIFLVNAGPGVLRQELGSVIAFDTADGRARWRAATDLHVEAPLTIHDGNLYGCGYADKAYAVAIDARTGAERWRQPVEELALAEHDGYDTDAYWNDDGFDRIGVRLMAPAVADQMVYVTARRPPELIALDAASGEERWSIVLDRLDEIAHQSRASGAPTVYDEAIYVGTHDGGLYAVDSTGNDRWAKPIEHGVSESVAADASGLYVSTSQGGLVKLGHTGREDWAVDVGGIRGAPTLTDQYVIGDMGWRAVIRSKDDGAEVWSFDPESETEEVGFEVMMYSGKPEALNLGSDGLYVATDTRKLLRFQ